MASDISWLENELKSRYKNVKSIHNISFNGLRLPLYKCQPCNPDGNLKIVLDSLDNVSDIKKYLIDLGMYFKSIRITNDTVYLFFS